MDAFLAYFVTPVFQHGASLVLIITNLYDAINAFSKEQGVNHGNHHVGRNELTVMFQ